MKSKIPMTNVQSNPNSLKPKARYDLEERTAETKYWLRQAVHACPNNADNARRLWKEAQELNLIFATIIKKTKNPIKK